MRIFLTGATGFLGSYAAAELLARGHAVTAAVRGGSDTRRIANLQDRLAIATLDIADTAALTRALAPGRFDAICHLAWNGVRGADRNDPAQGENVAITARLFDIAASAGVRAGLGIGSQAEYGPLNRTAREDDACQPTTRYGMAKLSACQAAQEIAERTGMRLAWARVFSTYGPGDHPDWMIPGTILTLLRGDRPALTGGAQLWDFLYAGDAAHAMATLLENDRASGLFNLGSGDAPPLRTTIETIRDLIDANAPLGFGEIPYRPDQVMHLQADITRLKALGWTPQTPLRDGLTRTVASLRSQP